MAESKADSVVAGFAGVPGVPEGWELVRIGSVKHGVDFVVGGQGTVELATPEMDETFYPIVRKAAPVCVWQKGVFKDGWIVQGSDGELSWHSHEPVSCYTSDGSRAWMMINGISANFSCTNDDGELVSGQMFLTPVVFRADLPFDKRIQKVGPAVERSE